MNEPQLRLATGIGPRQLPAARLPSLKNGLHLGLYRHVYPACCLQVGGTAVKVVLEPLVVHQVEAVWCAHGVTHFCFAGSQTGIAVLPHGGGSGHAWTHAA